jgi:hypothetical protein
VKADRGKGFTYLSYGGCCGNRGRLQGLTGKQHESAQLFGTGIWDGEDLAFKAFRFRPETYPFQNANAEEGVSTVLALRRHKAGQYRYANGPDRDMHCHKGESFGPPAAKPMQHRERNVWQQ